MPVPDDGHVGLPRRFRGGLAAVSKIGELEEKGDALVALTVLVGPLCPLDQWTGAHPL